MANSLGEIAVNPTLNSAQFLAGFGAAGVASKKFGSELSDSIEGVGGALQGVLGKFGEFGRSSPRHRSGNAGGFKRSCLLWQVGRHDRDDRRYRRWSGGGHPCGGRWRNRLGRPYGGIRGKLGEMSQRQVFPTQALAGPGSIRAEGRSGNRIDN